MSNKNPPPDGHRGGDFIVFSNSMDSGFPLGDFAAGSGLDFQ